MPYKIDGNCVYKVGDSKPMKCYDNHADALKYLGALEANVTDAKKERIEKAYTGMLSETEVNYVPVSTVEGKMCAGCRWFLNPEGCFIVRDWGDDAQPIMATGYCDRYEVNPPPEPTLTEVLSDAIANSSDSLSTAILAVLPTPPVDDMSKAVKPRKSFSEWIRSTKEKLFPDKQKEATFSVFKGIDGEYHWHAVYTNNFKDREGEILTKEGHDRFIGRLDMGLVPMPVLDLWHIEGTEHGQADVIWSEEIPSSDGTKEMVFVHAIGHFDDTPIGQKAIEVYQNGEVYKNSHAFLTPDWAFDGTHYLDFNTIKISTLPPHAAANPYTSFEELKEMTLTPEKLAYVGQFVDKEKLAQIQQADANKAKSLEALKVTYKDFADTTKPPPAAPTTPNDGNVVTSEKGAAMLFTEISEGQAEILDVLSMSAKAYESLVGRVKAIEDGVKAVDTKHETETSAWQKELDAIKQQINMPIERASNASVTVVPKDSEKLKDQTLRENDLAKFLPGIGLKNPSPV